VYFTTCWEGKIRISNTEFNLKFAVRLGRSLNAKKQNFAKLIRKEIRKGGRPIDGLLGVLKISYKKHKLET